MLNKFPGDSDALFEKMNSPDSVSLWTEDDDWVLILIQTFPEKRKVKAFRLVTVKSQTEESPSPTTPGVTQDVSQMESADANRIWREIAIFPFHSELPSDQFRKQS